MTAHKWRNERQHQRTKRACATPECPNVPEPKDRYCLACQLAGRAPLDGRRK